MYYPWMKIVILLFLAVPLVLCQAYQAFPVGPCHNLVAVNHDGLSRTANFDELTSMTTAEPFESWDAPKKYSYRWSICTNDGNGLNGQGAVQGGSFEANLGTYASPPIPAYYNTSYPMGAIKMTLTQTAQGRSAVITVICDPAAVTPEVLTPISADGFPPVYQLLIKHRSACGINPVSKVGQCHKIRPTDGSSNAVFSLDELSTLTAYAPLIANDPASNLRFQFGVCANISCAPSGEDSAGCGTSFPWGGVFPLGPFTLPIPGVQTSTSITHIKDAYLKGAVMIKQKVPHDRQMIVTVICDPVAIYPQNPYAIAPLPSDTAPLRFQVFVTHRSGCPI